MIKVLFICHGNICRSPMAEYILKRLTAQRGIADRFHIESAATSSEEIGNPIYPPAKAELARHGIHVTSHRARRIRPEDYDEYDYLIAMESYNIRNMMRVFRDDPDDKICRLLDFTGRPRDIADPWYTRDFGQTYTEIVEGCESFLEQL